MAQQPQDADQSPGNQPAQVAQQSPGNQPAQDADQSPGNQPVQIAQQSQSGSEALPPPRGAPPRNGVKRLLASITSQLGIALIASGIGLVGIVLGAFLGFYIPIKYTDTHTHPPDSIVTDLMHEEAVAATTLDAGKRAAIITSIYDSNAVVTDASCLSNTPAIWQGFPEIKKRYQLLQAQKFKALYHVQVAIAWNPSDNTATTATATAETIGLLSTTDQKSAEKQQFISGYEQWAFKKTGDDHWVITLFLYNLCSPSPSSLSTSSSGYSSFSSANVPCVSQYQEAPPGKLTLAGLAYSPSHIGQDPTPRTPVFPSPSEIKADMPTLALLTHKIRIYSSTGPAQEIVQAAAAVHMQVALGISLGIDPAANEREITAGEHLAATNKNVYALIVGNEVLHRGDMSAEALGAYIKRVHDDVHGSVQVTMADTYDQWLAHPELAENLDFVTVHIYPFWQGVSIDCAVPAVEKIYNAVKAAFRAKFPDKSIVIGETGWPSDASLQDGVISGPTTGSATGASGQATPNADNQARYLKEFTNWAQQNNVDYFYFAAFDEGWKTQEGAVGPHWGLYQQDGHVKAKLRDLLPEADPTTLKERSYRDVYVGGLESGYDLGIDTSEHQSGWLSSIGDVDGLALHLAYPANQQWGTMFVTVDKPAPLGERHSFDLSAYHSLVFDMRAAVDGQCVNIGIKDAGQPDDGTETKLPVCLTTQWTTYTLPLSQFSGANPRHLYVVFEVIFMGTSSVTIDLKNIRYSPT